jgi:hypothetical protein
MNNPVSDIIQTAPSDAMSDDPGAVTAVPGLATVPSIDAEPQSSDFDAPELPEKRGRGRPKKSDVAARLNSVSPAKPRAAPAAVAAPVPLLPAVNYVQMGQQAANLWFNAGELVLGADWQPSEGEPAIIAGAFKDYFQSVNATAIPPVWSLVIALTSYTAARVARPTVKTRLFGAYEWLKNKVKFQR